MQNHFTPRASVRWHYLIKEAQGKVPHEERYYHIIWAKPSMACNLLVALVRKVGRSLVSGGGPVGQVNRVNRRREAGCMRFGRVSEEALPVWRISTAQLNTLRCLHRRPIDLLVLEVP